MWSVLITKMHSGEYFHFEVSLGLQDVLSKVRFPISLDPFDIELLISVDGLLIFNNSTNKQSWVILRIVKGF